MKLSIPGIKCDASGCDYREDIGGLKTIEDCKKYLNKPCPKCGANLFTQADYEALLNLNTLVKSVGQNIPEEWKKDSPATMKVSMNGSGKIELSPPVIVGEEDTIIFRGKTHTRAEDIFPLPKSYWQGPLKNYVTYGKVAEEGIKSEYKYESTGKPVYLTPLPVAGHRSNVEMISDGKVYLWVGSKVYTTNV